MLKGEYSEYQQLILGRADNPNFPFHEAILLLGDPSSYLFYSDTRRWEKPTPAAAAEPSKTADSK